MVKPMNTKLVVLALTALMVLTACAQPQPEVRDVQTAPMPAEEPAQPEPEMVAEPEATSDAVDVDTSDIEQASEEVADIEEELDLSELEALEEELSALENLDLG